MPGSSFSVATTIFVSLAICAVISYGIFYYFKQRLSVIENSQMEQARILQALITHGIQAQAQAHAVASHQQPQDQQCHHYDKEITITQSGLIEVSSDGESDSDSNESDSSESNTESDSESESSKSDKWSIGDEIHQPDSYHQEFEENFKKNVLLETIYIDSSYKIDSITITTLPNDSVENTAAVEENASDSVSNKKIISLNKSALGNDADANESDDDVADDSSSSSSDEEEAQDNDKPNVKDLDLDLKIGYKTKKEPLHLNYGNMSVPALRQLAKERGLGGEDADLNKLKKKDLVQLLQ